MFSKKRTLTPNALNVMAVLLTILLLAGAVHAKQEPIGMPFQHLQNQVDSINNILRTFPGADSFFDRFVEIDTFNAFKNITNERLESINYRVDSFFDIFVEIDTFNEAVTQLKLKDSELEESIRKTCFAGCTGEYTPVCGIDDKTYINRCGAECEGIDIVHTGPCEEELAITCCDPKGTCFKSTTGKCRIGGGAVMECMPSPDLPPPDGDTSPVPGENINITQTNSSGPQNGWLQNMTRDVNSTGIHNLTYVPATHDCDDFAGELERNLTNMTYNATFTYYWCKRPDNTYFGHAVTDVHSPDGTIVWIEPQTGRVIDLDFDNDGTVEARTHHVNNRDAFTDGDCAIEIFEDKQSAINAGVIMD